MNALQTGWPLYILFTGLGMISALFIIGWRQSMRNPRRLAFLFLLFLGMTYVVRPPLTYLLGGGYEYAELYGIPLDHLPLTGVLVALAFIAFALGYRRNARKIEDSELIFRPLGNVTVSLCAFALVAVGYFARSVAPSEQIETFAGGSINATGLSFVSLAWLLIPAGLLLLYANTGKLLWPVLLGLPFLVISVRDAYGRYIFLTLIIGLASMFLLGQQRTRVKQLTILTIALGTFYFVFLAIGFDRVGFVESGDLSRNIGMLRQEHYYDMLGDFAGFEGTIYQVNTIHEEKPDYGTSLIYNLIIQPIPRIIWHNKPLPPEFTWNYILGRNRDSEEYRVGEGMLFYTNQVKGHVGYALQEFGYPGVALLFLLEGWLLGVVELWYARSNKGPCEVATYSVCYVLLIFTGRNTLFDYLSRYVIYFIIPYFAVWFIVLKGKRGAVHGATAGSRGRMISEKGLVPGR